MTSANIGTQGTDFHERNAWKNNKFEARLSFQRIEYGKWQICKGLMCWWGWAYEPWEAADRYFKTLSEAIRFCEEKDLVLT